MKIQSPIDKQQAEDIQSTVKYIFREYAEALALAVILALIIRYFVLAAYKISNLYMAPTLKPGDFIFAYKLPYGITVPLTGGVKVGRGQPQRGEVVIFKCPDDPTIYCIKRVIGIPGDRITIRKKQLIVNNVKAQYSPLKIEEVADLPGADYLLPFKESFKQNQYEVALTRSTNSLRFGPYIVPPGHFFVLNDNREDRRDSRSWGPVPFKSLEGRGLFIWFSLNWLSGNEGDWPKIRWNRIFKAID